jgi:hypothetical protein
LTVQLIKLDQTGSVPSDAVEERHEVNMQPTECANLRTERRAGVFRGKKVDDHLVEVS